MDNNSEVVSLYLDDIIPNRFQPREVFDEHALKELAVSIREHGIIQPIIVRKVEDKYEIIAGERRYKASTMAGLTKIPAIVKNLDDKECSKIALIENLQRKDLTPIEEARTYQKILDLEEGKLTQEALAATMGKTQSSVSNKLRLLALPEEIQDALLKEKISERHARSLLNVEDKNLQIKLLDKIIVDRMTVRELDKEIRELKEGKTPSEEKIEVKTKLLDEEEKPEEKKEEVKEEKSVGSDSMSFSFDLNGTDNKPSEDAGKGLLGSTNEGNEVKAASFGNGSWTLQDNSADLKQEESSDKVSLGLFGRKAREEKKEENTTAPVSLNIASFSANSSEEPTTPSTISTFSLTEEKKEEPADVSNLFSANAEQKTSDFSFQPSFELDFNKPEEKKEEPITAPVVIEKTKVEVETLDSVQPTVTTEPVTSPKMLVKSFDELFDSSPAEVPFEAGKTVNPVRKQNIAFKKDVNKAVGNIKNAVKALEDDGYKVVLEEQDGTSDYKITITLGKDA